MDPKKATETPPQQTPLPSPENQVESDTPMPRSHRNKALEHQARRNIVYAVVGIAIIIGLLGTFGTLGLQKLSEFALNTKEASEDEKKVETGIIVPPLLESSFTATNSADITITGTVDDGDVIKIYINGALAKKKDLKDEKDFTFDDVTLKEGVNVITAKVTKDGKDSNASDELRITYYEKAPTLDITSPADGRSFNGDQNPILVSGKTDPYAKVTVNDRRAIMETDGEFEYTLTLQGGDNDIKVIAEDSAGNKTEKHVKAILQ